MDIAIPEDKRVKDKEVEKLEKYQMLKEEMQRLWRMKPVVIGALGVVSQRFSGYVNKGGANIQLEIIQKTVLLGTARLLRKVLSL